MTPETDAGITLQSPDPFPGPAIDVTLLPAKAAELDAALTAGDGTMDLAGDRIGPVAPGRYRVSIAKRKVHEDGSITFSILVKGAA